MSEQPIVANEPVANRTLEEIASELLKLGVARSWYRNLTELGQQRKLIEWLVEVGVNDLLERTQADPAKIAELERVTGPAMPCGCRAVEMFPHGTLPNHTCCGRHKVIHEPTPEYLAWKESR